MAALDAHRAVEVDHRTFDRGRHDRQRRWVAAARLLHQQHRRGAQEHERGRRGGGRARQPPALSVPGLRRRGVHRNPLAGQRHHRFLIRGDTVDQPEFACAGRRERRAVDQQRHRRLEAEQAHQAHDAAAARKQAKTDLRQAQQDPPIVQREARVAGQAKFEAATERGAVDRCDNRPAQRLEPAQHRLHGHRTLVQRLHLVRRDRQQAVQVAAVEEGLLGGGDDHAADAVELARDAFDDGAVGLAKHRVHRVRRLARHVDGQGHDAGGVLVVADGLWGGCGHGAVLRRVR